MRESVRDNSPLWLPGRPLGRRRFLEGLAAGGVLLGASSLLRPAFGQAAPTATGSPPELRGTEFDLTIAATPVDFTGRPRLATTINGSVPGPTLRWREGDTVTLRVTDMRGQSTQTTQTLNIAPGTPPTASFVYSPTAPHAGQTIFFTAEASRAVGARRIVSYDWNFGSGRTATGMTVAKGYDQLGSYVVTLTVTDDAGQAGTVSQTINVVP